MATDVFSNPSNNYIIPGLAPCSNIGDDAYVKFFDDGVGVKRGADILQFLDLSGISILINSWVQEKKVIQSGEVIYVPGLDKGLTFQTQYFDISINEPNQQYYFIADVSLEYYYNFKYYNTNIHASADYSLNIDIEDALNIAIGNDNIKIEVSYDTSTLKFESTQEGYSFDVTNVVLTTIDSSTDTSSPFVDSSTYTLIEDESRSLPAFKYPNGAMLGYVLKATYPSEEDKEDRWIYMNHVKSPIEVYESVNVDSSVYYQRYTKTVDVGMNGHGNDEILSAGDYLDYVNNNDAWLKVGVFSSRFSTIDPYLSQQKNLINGFYIFNPHEFPVQIEYLLVNYNQDDN